MADLFAVDFQSLAEFVYAAFVMAIGSWRLSGGCVSPPIGDVCKSMAILFLLVLSAVGSVLCVYAFDVAFVVFIVVEFSAFLWFHICF